ncbi:MAG: glycoside hydrolase family 99-like domain-containing protein [Thermoguttaceae bacterium]|nr:glycoside hydrolase family 99-like domain-containing protein [Thermoguttaceae bacterium]
MKYPLHFFAAFFLILGFFSAALCRADETVLFDWQFNSPSDADGWNCGSIQDLKVENGVLKGIFTGRDPILNLPKCEFDVYPGVVFEVRIRLTNKTVPTQGELFFTNTNEGPYGGFSGQKMKQFPLPADGQFHTCRVVPGWVPEKRIIKLRLDPGTPQDDEFGKAGFEIDYVRVLDLNYRDLVPVIPEWDFTRPALPDGWTFLPDGSGKIGAAAKYKIGPIRQKDGEFNCWCALEMSVKKGTATRVLISNDTMKDPLEVTAELCHDGKPHVYNMMLTAKDFDPRQPHFITVEPSDVPDSGAVLKSVRFVSEPQGAAQLVVRPGAGLSDAIPRAGRPLPFEFMVFNPGGKPATGLKIANVELPKGLKIVSGQAPEKAVELESFDAENFRFEVQSARALQGSVRVTMEFQDGVSDEKQTQTFEFPVEIQPSLGLPKASYVPEPKPVMSEYEIGALYFPGWGKPEAWERIFPVAPIRKPVLGWYDEGNPECIDWQIKWAVENGIQYFLVDWYWNRGNQHLDHWVKGFQKAKYRKYFKWAMMWANHNGPGSHSEEDQAAVTKFWIENYFNTPEYYTIDGKPVVMIWSPEGMDRDIHEIYAKKGFELKKGEGVKKLLDLSRKMAQEAGFKGIYFISMKWPESSTDPASVQWLADAGFDMTSLYHYMHHGNKAPNPKYFSFDYCVDSIGDYWEARQETGILPFLPNLSTGWDSRPWHGLRQTVIYDRTPEKFRKICETCKEFTRKNGIRNILVAPLNEWGEGSYAEPNREFGFGMYEALRETFCEKPADGWPVNYGPADVGLGPYDFDFAASRIKTRDVLNVTFDDPAAPQPWKEMMGVTKPEIVDGKFVFTTNHWDPAIQASFGNLRASRVSKITVRMRVTPPAGQSPGAAQLFWATPMMSASETTSLHAPLIPDGQFHDCVFPVGDSRFWQGKISSLRLDPCSVQGAKVEIDEIRME